MVGSVIAKIRTLPVHTIHPRYPHPIHQIHPDVRKCIKLYNKREYSCIADIYLPYKIPFLIKSCILLTNVEKDKIECIYKDERNK